MTAIQVRGATRRYVSRGAPDVVAVGGVDLHVDDGEFVAIEGPSGSGKSTLLGLLAGIELPDDGNVTVLGHDLARLSAAERARLRQRRVGMIFQAFGLLASLSAGENVALPLALAGQPETERRARAAAELEEVGLGGAIDARIDELSGGERQRVAVARALAIDPAIILADEPTGSLDEGQGSVVLDLLTRAVAQRGAALVLVTHDPSTAGRAQRRYAMRDGRFVAAAT
jgi:putative ABC transport system ATP-binding protein